MLPIKIAATRQLLTIAQERNKRMHFKGARADLEQATESLNRALGSLNSGATGNATGAMDAATRKLMEVAGVRQMADKSAASKLSEVQKSLLEGAQGNRRKAGDPVGAAAYAQYQVLLNKEPSSLKGLTAFLKTDGGQKQIASALETLKLKQDVLQRVGTEQASVNQLLKQGSQVDLKLLGSIKGGQWDAHRP